ncbi:MAG TPA: autotransporter domain-containing protein [Chthoniobacterales bacterium]
MPNYTDNTASVIDTATNTVSSTVALGLNPVSAVVTPDARYAYATNFSANTVSVIDTSTHTVVNTIAVGTNPEGLALAPDGLHAYVVNYSDGTVSVIDTTTNAVVNTIAVGTGPIGVTVTPDGLHAYVTNGTANTVSVIDTATATVVGSPITVGTGPQTVAVTPDSLHAYVVNKTAGTVSVIDTATGTIVNTITVGASPLGVIVTPDGLHAYVTNLSDNTVSVIDTATGTVVNTIAVGTNPSGVAATPDGLHAYVVNSTDNTVSIIDTATNAVAGVPITVGNLPVSYGSFIGPNLITGTLPVGSEAQLTSLGFGQFVNFRGGTLQTTASLTDAHTVSLLAAGGTIDTNGFDSTFSGTVIGAGALTKTGAGTLTLSGTNTYAGGTTVSGGTLSVALDANLGNPSGGLTLDGGELLATGSTFATFRPIALTTNGGTLAATANNFAVFWGNLTGPGGLTVGDAVNAGTVVLVGANAYAGSTTIVTGATLSANSSGALSPASAFVVDGTLVLNQHGNQIGSLAGTGVVTDNGSGGTDVLTVGGDNTSTTFSGTVHENGLSLALVKVGTGTLALSGTNTYSGGTTVSGNGTLSVSTDANLGDPSGGLTLNGARLFIFGDQNGNFATGRTLTLGNAGTNTLAAPDNNRLYTATFTGQVTGPGGLTVGDTNSQELRLILTNPSNNYQGGTTITHNNFLLVGTDGALGNVGGGITMSGGQLEITTTGFDSARGITLIPSIFGNVLGVDPGVIATYTGPISGTGGLSVGDNGGTVVLTNTTNSFTGGITSELGTLSVASDLALGDPSGGIALADGEVLTTADGFATARPVSLQTYNGGLNILAASAGTTAAYQGVVSGGGGLQVGDGTNAGTVVLASGANTYTGGTTVFGNAVLSVDTDAELGDPSGGIVLKLGGELLTTANFTSARSVSLNPSVNLGGGIVTPSIPSSPNTLAAAAGTTATYTGVVSGTGGLWIGDGDDFGTVVLTAVNTYTGGTTVWTGATLSVAADTAFGDASGGLALNGGKLLTTADVTTPRTITLNPTSGADALAAATGTTATYSGVISGPGALTVGDGTNAGTVVFTSTNSYAGGTAVLPGTLVAATSDALGTGPATLYGGALQILAAVKLGNPLFFGPGGGSLLNAGTLNNNVLDASNGCGCPQWVENDQGGAINGNVLLGTGPNTVQLYSGSTISGNLDLGTNAGSTLILNGAGDQVWSAAVTGTEASEGSLVKLGSGTWTLDQPIAAPVGTTVAAGGLVIDSTLTSALVTVQNGATLGGSGTVAGNLTNNGLLQPGSSAVPGTLTVTGNYTQGSSGSFSVRLASAATYDQLHVGGTAGLGGNLNWVTTGGYTPAPGSLFTILTAGGGTSGSYASVTHSQGVQLTLQVNANTVTLSSPLSTGGGSGTGSAGGSGGANGTFVSVPTNPDNSTTPTAPTVVTLAPGGLVTETFYPFRLFATNSNQYGVAGALDQARFTSGAESDFTAAINTASQLQGSRLTHAFDQLSPSAVAAFSTIAFTLQSAQAAQLDQRLEALREGDEAFQLNNQPVPADAGKAVTAPDDGKGGGKEAYRPSPMVEVAHGERWGAFVTGSGTFAGVDRASDLFGYNFNTGGVTAGLDYRLTRTWAVGLYGGYAHTRADFEGDSRLDVDGAKGGLYSTWRHGGFYLNGSVGGGYNSYGLRRSIDFVNRTARSDPEGWEFDASGGLGYDWHFGPLTAGVNASLLYTHLDVRGFTETGANSLDLQVSSNHADSLRQYLGGHLYYTWRVSPSLTVTPEADLAWQHEYLDGGRSIDASFQAGAGPAFAIRTNRAQGDSAFGGTGVTATYKNVSAYFFYNPEFGSGNLISHTISGGFRVSF